MNFIREVFLAPAAQKEIRSWPLEIKKDLGALLTKLQRGDFVSYPDSSPMKSVASGCFELRLRGAEGIYRVFYILKSEIGIVVFHAFQKKTQKTPLQEIETGKRRLKLFLQELLDEENG
ncbi:hypothetical protein D3C87_1600340 [compost metagenome]